MQVAKKRRGTGITNPDAPALKTILYSFYFFFNEMPS